MTLPVDSEKLSHCARHDLVQDFKLHCKVILSYLEIYYSCPFE